TRDPRFVETLQAEGGKPENMDKLLDMIEARGEERGIAIGEERGIAIGEERGIAIGIQKGMIVTLADLVKDNTLSLQAAAEKANMTVAEFEHEVRLLADPIK
ncbi:MAG: transposase, partial [Firmicutes bacterium]|nr:transposase [Bacillota bacterium]